MATVFKALAKGSEPEKHFSFSWLLCLLNRMCYNAEIFFKFCNNKTVQTELYSSMILVKNYQAISIPKTQFNINVVPAVTFDLFVLSGLILIFFQLASNSITLSKLQF